MLKHSILHQDKIIKKFQLFLERKKKIADDLLTEIPQPSSKKVKLVPIISETAAKLRQKNLTSHENTLKTKQRRRNETLNACIAAIHGASKENPAPPALTGLIDTINSKFKSDQISNKILTSKSSVSNAISKKCESQCHNDYYKSEENLLRSLNVYYSYNVMGKRKFMNIRKSNKSPDTPNYVSYKNLSKRIRDIDIGIVYNINPILTDGLPEEEIGEGMFRYLSQFALRLVEFYINVNDSRVDKLKEFKNILRKYSSSVLFLLAVGGDETGTSFLISFLNAGKCIASSFENYLLFSANVKENGAVVRHYITKLMSDIAYLESKVFAVTVKGV